MEQNKIQIKMLTNDLINIEEIERVRLDSYSIQSSPINQLYYDSIKSGKFLVFGCYYDNELVGGAYLSDFRNSLYIEQIFIKKEMQRNHLGRFLLSYILQNKELIEMYFHKEFQYSKLESRNCDGFYKLMGYRVSNNGIDEIMKKRI